MLQVVVPEVLVRSTLGYGDGTIMFWGWYIML